MYARKFQLDRAKLMERLWGDHFFDAASKKWRHTSHADADGTTLQRAFNQFVLRPIQQLYDSIMDDRREQYTKMIAALNIKLGSTDHHLLGRPLFKAIMHRFLPMADTLLEMMILRLPSPIEAQAYRVETLYEGPLDDECAQAMRRCDPTGPLMIYVSSMVPSVSRDRFYAFGRVFSGTLRNGMTARIMGPNYRPGKKHDLFTKTIGRMLLVAGNSVEYVDDCPCGNIVGVIGVDSYLLKCGTISDTEAAHAIRPLAPSTSPKIRVAVEPVNPADLPKFILALRRLSKCCPLVECVVEDSGQHVISALSERHLETVLKDLEDFCGAPLRRSDPFVSYRETVTATSYRVCLSKSPNKHNRFFCTAEPAPDGLAEAIESREVDPHEHPKLLAKKLVDTFDMDPTDARKIWCFGPEETGTNLLLNKCFQVANLDEIKESCSAAFHWATREGVLCEEQMRGIHFNLLDATLHADAIHRGGGQVIPTMRRVLYASCLTAQPRIMEPVYLAEIECPESALGLVYNLLDHRRGHVFAEERRAATLLSSIKAYLPVKESLGILEDLLSRTEGRASLQYVFDHWQIVPSDPYENGTPAESIVLAIRRRKGLVEELPPLTRFLDVL